MGENSPEVPEDPDEKMAEGGAGVLGPQPLKALFKGQLRGNRGTLTTKHPDDPTRVLKVPINDIPRAPKPK